MTAIRIEFLDTVRAGAERLEWPPHPARLFSAMVSAYHDGTGTLEERDTLLYLEKLEPGEMTVPNMGRRETPIAYVPSNMRTKKATVGKTCQPFQSHRFLRRLKSGRRFPAGNVDGPVYYHLPSVTELDHKVLSRLISRVPYLGTTSSTCLGSVAKDAPEANFFPIGLSTRQSDTIALRVPFPGFLTSLEESYQANLKTLATKGIRMRKPATRWWQYATQNQQVAADGEFSEMIPLKIEGPSIGLAQGPELCRVFRRALIDSVPDPVPELVSGHLYDGALSKKSHLGFVPLPFVGHRHADGHIMGIGLLVPRGTAQSDRFALLKGLSKLKTLHTAIGNYTVDQFASSWSLNAQRYTSDSTEWVTVTPIELPTFPRKKLLPSDLIASACKHSGLPQPRHVHVSQHGLMKGVVSSRHFPRNRCPLYHARITFERPVAGPVSIGRGRYLGHGLCLPVTSEV